MRRIDQRIDPMIAQIMDEPIDAAEASDARLALRCARMRYASCQRIDEVKLLIAQQRVGKLESMLRSTQNENSFQRFSPEDVRVLFASVAALRIKIALAELRLPQRPAHKDQRCPIDAGIGNDLLNVVECATQHAFIGPACAKDDDDRALRTIEGRKLRYDLIQVLNGQMNRHRGAGSSQRRQVFAFRHLR